MNLELKSNKGVSLANNSHVTIFTVCSHTFILFLLRQTTIKVKTYLLIIKLLIETKPIVCLPWEILHYKISREKLEPVQVQVFLLRSYNIC